MAGKKVKRDPKKIALIVLLIILGLAIIVGAVVFILHNIGKNELYNNTKYETPEIRGADDGTVKYEGHTYRYNEDIITFLIMGIDQQSATVSQMKNNTDATKGGQADTLFLVVINPDSQKISIISVNRNSMAEVDIYNKNNEFVRTDLAQICLQHAYGSGLEDSCDRQVLTVSKLFYNLPIHGYAALNMKAILKLNHIVDGIDLVSIENIERGSSTLKSSKGKEIHLSDEDALAYVTYRNENVLDSVSMRMARQKQYLKELVGKLVAKTKNNITFPLNVMENISDYLVTDINSSRVTYIATSFLGYDIDFDNIGSLKGETIVGNGGFEEFYVDDDALYKMIIENFYEQID